MTDPAAQLVDRTALRDLAERYASGVDRRDTELFLSAFLPDATLQVFDPAGGEGRPMMTGHDQIGRIPTFITRYAQTFHFLGNSRYEIDADRATGEVYCMAHHLTPDRHGGTTFVMYIRYQDDYRRDPGGDWRIAARRVLVDWTDVRAALPVPAS